MWKFLLLVFICLLSSNSYAVIPWQEKIRCEGPSGEAVIDEFVYTAYGLPVFQQQLVIRNVTINKWLFNRGVVANEIAMNYPDELIVNLQMNVDEIPLEPNQIIKNYHATLGAFFYTVKVELPEVSFYAHSRETGHELANWIFRECWHVQ